MDNLPNDPSDPNNSNNSTPPAFGSNFDPHTNPVDPNNPYASQTTQPPTSPNPLNTPNTPARNASHSDADGPELPENPHHPTHSDVAQHRQRDAHGHFLPYEHSVNPEPQAPDSPTTPTSPNIPNTPNSSLFPPLVETDPKQDSKDSDPPIFTIRNPITYIKRWWNRIIAKEGVDFKLGFKIRPITAVLIASIIISGGVSSGVTALVLKTFWPTSSPILHRQIIQQGIIQKSATGGFYLTASDQSIWKLKAKNPNINFADQTGKLVTVTGNMTKDNNVIEVSEVILQTP